MMMTLETCLKLICVWALNARSACSSLIVSCVFRMDREAFLRRKASMEKKRSLRGDKKKNKERSGGEGKPAAPKKREEVKRHDSAETLQNALGITDVLRVTASERSPYPCDVATGSTLIAVSFCPVHQFRTATDEV